MGGKQDRNPDHKRIEMDEFKKLNKDLARTIKKMEKMSTEILQKVRDQQPEKIDGILSDQAKIMQAIKSRDVDALHKIHTKYADNNNQ